MPPQEQPCLQGPQWSFTVHLGSRSFVTLQLQSSTDVVSEADDPTPGELSEACPST